MRVAVIQQDEYWCILGGFYMLNEVFQKQKKIFAVIHPDGWAVPFEPAGAPVKK